MIAKKPRPQLTVASVSELHRQWLELVDADGPFLAIPPLKRVWPQGMPSLSDERKDALRYARKDFESAWENFDRVGGGEPALETYRVARNKWVETVLRDVAGWSESLSWGQVPGVQAQSPNRLVTVTADAALNGPDGIGALVYLVDPVDSLREKSNDLWATTPIDRMEALLRENNIQIGVVTDGRWWALVCARPGSMTASGIVDSLTWIEEPRTRDAFLTVIGRQYIIGGDAAERLPVLFEESVAAAEEITEALGAQVRRAVELLIQSFSESAAEARRRGQLDPLPTDTHQIYEAAVTIMMRVVFLLFAEERGLLPTGELFEQGYGIAGEMDRLQAREIQESEEALDSTFLTWHRLLATSQAVFNGATFESMRMPAYGGSLFDPTRFAFLTDTTAQGMLSLTVSDRVMLHVLRSVQQAMLRGGEARRISFRDIDVEQIGYIYEGLLGYTAVAVEETYLGMRGTAGEEPEIPLSVLEAMASRHDEPKALAASILEWIERDQPAAKPQSEAAIAKAVGAQADPNSVSALTQILGHDRELRDRILPRLALVRLDLRGRPMVVLKGGLMVKETPSRRHSGTHYTPRWLAEEVVLRSLQPLCYQPGPHQTAEEIEWQLKSSNEILNLKVVDIACGSGAFLVSAARYLADRVVEAWMSEDSSNVHRRDLHLRAVREVVSRCLFGADINDMAVEMCKLSLWLVSLDRNLPFSFVDDKIFLGNSLLGITSLDQIRKLRMDPQGAAVTGMFEIFDIDVDAIIRKAADLRRDLASEVVERDPARNSVAKGRQLNELHNVTNDLRAIADGIVAAGLKVGGKPGRQLDEAYENLRLAVKAAYPKSGKPDRGQLDAITSNGLEPTVPTDYIRWRPLHWVIEAPDVIAERGGFDAVIGNPPFLVHKRLGGAVGENVREYWMNTMSPGTRGKCDQVVFFLLRATQLLAPGVSTIGLIASKAVAEGTTREVGLAKLVDGPNPQFKIYSAVRSQKWPAAAQVFYSIIWLSREWHGRVIIGTERASVINSMLEDSVGNRTPQKLAANRSICHQGVIPQGKGFFVSQDEYAELVSRDASSIDVLKPFLDGHDITDDPHLSPSRYVIDFGERTEGEAARFRAVFDYATARIKPERMQKDARKYPRMVNEWWKHWNPRLLMRSLLSEISECLVIVGHAKYVVPVRVSSSYVPSSALRVFCSESYELQAFLSSSIHTEWAIHWGSRLEDAIRYNPSVVFESIPLPPADSRLNEFGRSLQSERQEIMSCRELGLTNLYNLVNDPSVSNAADQGVARMRELQVELDKAVLDAYGWSDIKMNHGFHTYRGMDRWTVSSAARAEILDRLLDENQRRAAKEEVAAPVMKGARGRASVNEGEALF